MPTTSDPSDNLQHKQQGNGTFIDFHTYTDNCGQDLYNITYFDAPPGERFSGSLQQVIQLGLRENAPQAVITNGKNITLNGNAGWQYTITQPIASIVSNTETTFGTVYLINNRIFEVEVAAPTLVFSQDRATAFVGSFRAN